MTAVITTQNAISYDTGEGGTTMTFLIHPDHITYNDRDRTMRAAERYEIERALREADEQHRAERRARRQGRTRHYVRAVFGRFA
jgi:hypothetical protein